MSRPAERRQAQVINAPSRPPIDSHVSIFLAGTTTKTGTGPDWRDTLIDALSHLPVAIFNPLRPDWDSSWREQVDFAPFRQQVEWELDMKERSEIVVLYFGPHTDAPISLLELGLCARHNREVIVVCDRDYRKRGNVQIVSRRLGLTFLDGDEDLAPVVIERARMCLDRSE